MESCGLALLEFERQLSLLSTNAIHQFFHLWNGDSGGSCSLQGGCRVL